MTLADEGDGEQKFDGVWGYAEGIVTHTVKGRRRGEVGERQRECARKWHDNTVILLATIIHGSEELMAREMDNIDDFDEELFRTHWLWTWPWFSLQSELMKIVVGELTGAEDNMDALEMFP
jgi:hypothetical protein